MKSFIFYPSYLEHAKSRENIGQILSTIIFLGCGDELPEELKEISLPSYIHKNLKKYSREVDNDT